MAEIDTEHRSDPLRAALWMIGAIASFSSMAVAGRQVAGELDTFEIMLYRSIIGVAIVTAAATATGRLSEIETRHMHLHLARNAFHFAGQNLWFYAVTVIPLAQVFALEFTSPIWVMLLAPLILGERLTPARGLAAVFGFAGALLVVRPGGGEISPGVLAAAASAVNFAATFMFTKLLTRRATVTGILFWLTVLQSLMGLTIAGIDGDVALPSAKTAPWLVLIGCAGLFAHLCVTSALSVAPATVVVPLDFLRLPLIAVIGMVFYSEPIDAFVLAGAAIIFGANYLNIWSEGRNVTAK